MFQRGIRADKWELKELQKNIFRHSDQKRIWEKESRRYDELDIKKIQSLQHRIEHME